MSDISLRKDLSIGQNSGDGNFIFGQISKICLDKEDNIYVLDISNSRIQKFNTNGDFLLSIPIQKGQGPQEISIYPQLAVTPQGEIGLLDMYARKIVILDPEGTYLRHFLLDFQVRDIAPYSENSFALLGFKNDSIIHIVSLEGKSLMSFADPFPIPRKYDQHKDMPVLKMPNQISGSKDGIIYLLNPFKNEIVIYTEGKFTAAIKIGNPLYKPLLLTKSNIGGVGIVFPVAYVNPIKKLLCVTVQGPGIDPENQMDILSEGKAIASIVLKGFPYAVDRQGYLYISEGEDYPLVVRYKLAL